MRRIKIGNTIKKYREKNGYTLREMGEEIGLSASFLCEIESNKSRPSYENLIKIACFLDIPIEDLLESAGSCREPA